MNPVSLARNRSPLELLEEVISKHGPPTHALFTTFTFDADFFTRTITPLICGPYGEYSRSVAFQVVCDGRMYRGHSGGPWVARWPGTLLFHPKAWLLVFRDATCLIAGSANLTHPGMMQNQELVAWREWRRPGLPAGLASLVRRLDGRLSSDLLRLSRLESSDFLCSLDRKPAAFFEHRRADEVVVVSPFFDADEPQDDLSLDYLHALVSARRPSRVRLFVPMFEEGSRRVIPLRRNVLEQFGDALDLRGVPSDDRRLHAKLFAVCRDGRAAMLFGSANATKAGMSGRNVEACWTAETTQDELLDWLPSAEQLDLDDVICRPVSRKVSQALSVLRRAVFDPVEETLTLEWRDGLRPDAVIVEYEGRPLRPNGTVVRHFRISGDWFLVARSKAQEPNKVPIEIEGDFAGARDEALPQEPTPEELLAMLGAAPPVAPVDLPAGRRRTKAASMWLSSGGFELHARVRGLASQMAAARAKLMTDDGAAATVEATFVAQHLLRVARAHDPARRGIAPNEALWRFWVRCEIAVLLQGARGSRYRRVRERVDRLLTTRGLNVDQRTIAALVRREILG